jgi:RsiW-degrading membrane proteinase PrsW (M82 family)
MPPRRYMGIAFALGALSAGLAIAGEFGFGGALLPFSATEVDLGTIVLVAVVAPLIEELVKPIGLLLIHKEERPSLTMMDWALLGLFAGLGFALLEDALYTLNMAQYGTGAMLVLMGTRLAFPLHLITTTLAGAGYGLYARSGKPADFARYLVLAMLVHGAFNFAVTVVG